MVEIKIPAGAEQIIHALNNAGFEAYIVGGCVRDSMLGIEPHDWDICTSATPQQAMEIVLQDIDCKVLETGLKHGTITVVSDVDCYEVTTFRKDGLYTDSRRPDSVEFVSDLREDLARRDFTINAMAYSHETGLIDYFGSQDDLSNGVVSCVGNPDDRFSEDALRILRAVRFASTYGFRIDSGTKKSILENVWRLKNVSSERVFQELRRMLSGRGVLDILLEYPDVITTIIPEMAPCVGFEQNNKYHQYTVYEHIAHAVANYRGDDEIVNMALLLHDIGKPMCYTEDKNGGHFYGHGVPSRDIADKVLERLRSSNYFRRSVAELVLYHDATIDPTPKVVRKWLNKIGEEQFSRLLDVRIADILAHAEGTQASRIERRNALKLLLDQAIEEQQCFSLKDLAISGRDIMNLGIPEGKEVGLVLKSVLDKVIAGELKNEKALLIEAAKQMTGR